MSDSFWQDWSNSKSEFNKKRKSTNARRILSLLNNNGITYEETEMPNVILIKSENTEAYMSLTTGYTELFKVRFKGKAQWYRFTRKKLIETFSKKWSTELTMPILTKARHRPLNGSRERKTLKQWKRLFFLLKELTWMYPLEI
jgi:hypothetical protein